MKGEVLPPGTSVFEQATLDSAKIFRLPPGLSVDVLGEEGDFYQVAIYGRERGGYVPKSAVAVVAEAPVVAATGRGRGNAAAEERSLTMAQAITYPVTFDVVYPERMSRWRIFQAFLLLPAFVLYMAVSSIPGNVAFGFWFLIVFTGRIPRWLFDASVNSLRWMAQLNAYSYLLTDRYPSLEGEHPVSFDVEFDAHPGRLSTFFRLFLLIPHWIVLYFLAIALLVTTFIAWWAILFVGRYPRGLHRFGVGVSRWSNRVQGYGMLLTDRYPPFSLAP